MKKIFRTITALVLLLALFSGCSADRISYRSLVDYSKLDASAAEQKLGGERVTLSIPGREARQTYIPVIVSAQYDGVWLPMKEGIERAAKEYNITVDYFVSPSGSDGQEQTDAFKDILTKNPQAICLIAADTSKLTAYLNKVIASDIPIVSLDNSLPAGSVAYCRANGRSVGEVAASRLAEVIRSRGKIAIAASDWKNVTSAEIIESFKKAVEDNFPKIEVVNVPNNPDVSMREQCSAFFAANPSIEAVFGTDREAFECLISASRALREPAADDESSEESESSGKNDNKNSKDEEPRIVYVSGVGTSPAIDEAIVAGEALGTYIIDYTEWGYKAMTTAFSACVGGEFEQEILTDFIWIDTSNMELPLIKRLLSY